MEIRSKKATQSKISNFKKPRTNIEKKKKKTKKWIKARHSIIKALAYPTLGTYVKLKAQVTLERFKAQEKRPYLILSNHQTGYDQFFADMVFKGPVYMVASEDIFSAGFVSKLLRFFINPIPIKKNTHDLNAVMTCLRVAKEGGSIAIFPEGNRTYSGKTEYINPSIAKLAKKLKLPIAFMLIEGGYGIKPRWSDVVRKGKMRVYVSRVMQPEEFENYSADELNDVIQRKLFIDENLSPAEFIHTKSAEYLERAMYVCPDCGLSVFESNGDIIECKTCRKQIRYLPNKTLQGVGFEFPFKNIGEWYDYQTDFISKLDISPFENVPIFVDEDVSTSNVVLYKRKQLLQKGATMSAFNDRFVFSKDGENTVLTFDEVSAVTVLGKNKLNIYLDNNKKIRQIKGNKRFNALKYVQFYYHYKNIKAGVENGKFLGL